MTNTHTPENHNDILNALSNNNLISVNKMLEELRFSGNSSDIPLLIELLHRASDKDIKSKIIGMLSSLKSNEAVPILVGAIENKNYAADIKDLVTCCWGNGLGYEKYLPVFTNILITSNLHVAIEAYSVITNMTTKIDQQIIEAEIEKLKRAITNADREKKELILDVINFLPSIGD